MREILFKAKRIDNGEWVEGFYCKRKTGHYDNIGFHDEYKDCIIVEFSDGGIAFYDVDQTTICQYTGLNDKNGKKIWENDVVSCYGGEWCQGFWEHNETAKVDIMNWQTMGLLTESEFSEVIGNIFDNPELLESEE